MHNPFSLYWNKDWTFQLVHIEGKIYIEAKGVRDSYEKDLLSQRKSIRAADNLVYIEDKNRNPFSIIGSKKIINY